MDINAAMKGVDFILRCINVSEDNPMQSEQLVFGCACGWVGVLRLLAESTPTLVGGLRAMKY